MPGALTLAIEISNPAIPQPGVAVGEVLRGGVREIGSEPVRPSTRQDDDLVPAIDRLFKRQRLSPSDIGRVAVSVGPGGYTSMRMAVAAGKMIAEAGGARCVAVPSTLVVAHALREQSPPLPFVVAMASKNDSAYTALFGPAFDREPPPVGRVIDASQLESLGARTLIGDEHLPAAFIEAAKNLGMAILRPVLSAAACLRASANLPEIDPAALVPIYARQPEAVTLWQARRPRP